MRQGFFLYEKQQAKGQEQGCNRLCVVQQQQQREHLSTENGLTRAAQHVTILA
jgi:hypothetical protein